MKPLGVVGGKPLGVVGEEAVWGKAIRCSEKGSH
jgi:hypothetical protein